MPIPRYNCSANTSQRGFVYFITLSKLLAMFGYFMYIMFTKSTYTNVAQDDQFSLKTTNIKLVDQISENTKKKQG